MCTHALDALLDAAPFLTTLPNWLLNSGTGSRLSGQNLHLVKFVLENKLDGRVRGKGSVQSIHVAQHRRDIVIYRAGRSALSRRFAVFAGRRLLHHHERHRSTCLRCDCPDLLECLSGSLYTLESNRLRTEMLTHA